MDCPIETQKEVAQAFRKLFLCGPSRLCTVKGTEFYNQQLKAVLAANNVMLNSTENEEKLSVVEWCNRNQVFVKWKGYSDAFNLWVPLTDFEALKTVVKTILSSCGIYEDGKNTFTCLETTRIQGS